MNRIIKLFLQEYKCKLTENEFTSPLVKWLFYILNALQILFTWTGHVRVWLYALNKRSWIKIIVTSWVFVSLILLILLNFFSYNNLFVVLLNYYRIYEILLVNLWMFIFRQGATRAFDSNNEIDIIKKKEQNIRLLMLLMIQYINMIFCFAGLYRYQFSKDPGAFNLDCMGYFDSIYISFISIATLGYSDIYPLIDASRKLYSLEIFTGLFFILLFISAILNEISFSWRNSKS